MTKEERLDLIKKIENKRSSKVIAYILGDREGYPSGAVPNLATQIGYDAIRPFHTHLEELSKQGEIPKIDLFLYSRGGRTTVAPRIVHLIREYSEKFSVLAPYRAHSAATLICLGADEIVMGKLAELSPVDPTTANVFNPIDPMNPAGRWPISVEDVTAYLSLAKEKAGLDTEESTKDVFKALSDKVHPVALGNVHRVYNLIRLIVPQLLSLHMDITKSDEERKIEDIVKILTEKLFTHDYLISRDEAEKDIGLKVVRPSPDLDDLMWKLYTQYESDLKLLQPFNPANLLGSQMQTTFSEETGYIESLAQTDAFVQEGDIFPPPTLQQIQNIMAVLPPQLIAQMLPQLLPQMVMLAQQLSLFPPSVKFKSQRWITL